MPWPTVPIITTGMDADTDALPRADILDLTTKFNELIAMRGVALGVCDLDGSALVPVARIPDAIARLSEAPFTGPVSSTAGDLNLKSNTALADDAAILTAATLVGGEATITPTAARIRQLPLATAILAQAGFQNAVDGSCFDFTLVNLAAFDVSLSVNTGATIVGRAVINNGSATFRVRRLTSTTVECKRLEGAAALGYMHVRDEKASGTNGANSVAATQNIRVLNTVVANTIAGAALSVNQITLPAGAYRVWARAPAQLANGHKVRLQNITDATTALIGSSALSNLTADQVQTDSIISGAVFTISAAKVFELQHYTSLGNTAGLGRNTASGQVEVYAEILMIKEA